MTAAPTGGVAVVGMYGRFPGAPDLATYWRNLSLGIESLDAFSDEELLAAGVDRGSLEDPRLVRAGRVLAGIEEFDAAFFGYTPREAELLDPQQRLFLQGAWAALEDAGYSAEDHRGPVAVYAGTSLNTYLLNNLVPARGTRIAPHDLVALLGSDKDFLTTRVSYHLGLEGPSFAVQCGCSSSLVAVVQACHALAAHQCDMALAGGASVAVPQKRGYLYDPGGILSPDGHCRPFDARAQGTSFGSGLGIVVLKRLEDALADGDTIRAVVRGAAINNDGAGKLGYTAPSPERQAEVIAMAQALAEVEPRTITYVEAHGTATALGDAVELAALNQVFGAAGGKPPSCALGSVKGNIGHLDAASGVAGLIKTVLALEHRRIPPSLNFERPAPGLELEGSRFFVNTELRDWPDQGTPRRAGVSSFGIGGTNAHLVLEEAPPAAAPAPARSHHVLTLSARSAGALERACARLAAHLEARPELELADAAHTLQVGRRAFEHRRAVVAADRAEALRGLTEPGESPESARAGWTFLFPGAEAARPAAGRELYLGEPSFRARLDHCSERLRPHLGLDLGELLQAGRPPAPDAWTRLAPPALFALEYALAQLWKEWGLAPRALLGRGAGALVAACLAGVLRLDDALALAAALGRGGPAFAEALRDVALRPPLVPLLSDLTGERLSPQQAMSPRYWERWVGGADRVAEALALAAADEEQRFLELGPAPAPGAADAWPGVRVLPSLGAGADASETGTLARALAAVWESGTRIDWDAHHRHAPRRRVPLPTYPFEPARHWFAPGGDADDPGRSTERSADPGRWFHLPSWTLAPTPPDDPPGDGRWLLLVDGRGFWEPLVESLRAAGREVVTVRPGERFEQLGPDAFAVAPAEREHHDRLAAALGPAERTRIVHLWLAEPEEPTPEAAVDRGLLALYHLVDALAAAGARGPAGGPGEQAVTIVTWGGQQVDGEEPRPAVALALGAARVLPQDRPWARARWVDLAPPATASAPPELVALVARELGDAATEATVAHRGRQRWTPRFEAVALPDAGRPACLREHGVYLITGGLGGIGRTLAEYLAAEVGARLVLCGRTLPPEPERWGELPEWRWLAELRARGVPVLALEADAADRAAMARAVATARETFGGLHGVIHAAGVPGAGLLQGEDRAPSGAALPAKVAGTLILEELCGEEPDFVVLCSALATVLGGIGQSDYCAANAFMDAFARRRRTAPAGPRWVSIGWDAWREVGMAADARLPEALRPRQRELLRDGLTREEGVEVFRRVLASPHAHVLVSTRPLGHRLAGPTPPASPSGNGSVATGTPADAQAPDASGGDTPASPAEIEATVTRLWTRLLGVETASPEDNFFAQGGNSLLATQMLGGLLREFPRADVSLRRFFEEPTVAGLTRAIAERFGSAGEGPDGERAGGLRERLEAAAPGERAALLRAYLEREVAAAVGAAPGELDGAGDLGGLDETLIAAHLTWVVRRDLELPLYPHEVRGRRSLDELAGHLEAELARLAAPMATTAAATVGGETAHASVAGSPRLEPAARNPSMAFVLSAPRSGSTLLRVMLSGHPGLFCPPELFLLDNDTMGSWERDPFSEFYRDGLARAFMALRSIEFPEAQALVRELVARDAPVHEVYGLLQEGGHLLVDKTPTYALSKTTLEQAERLFERPRHVLLVRHPLAVIDSIVRNRLDRVRRAVGDPYQLAERYWVQTYRNLAELRERVGDERCRLVRYEDLVREPAEVMAELCTFLGVDFDPAVLDPYGSGRMLGGPGDPRFFERGAIDPRLGEAWREVELPRPLDRPCAELATRLGYELP